MTWIDAKERQPKLRSDMMSGWQWRIVHTSSGSFPACWTGFKWLDDENSRLQPIWWLATPEDEE